MTAVLEGCEWLAARPGRTLPPGKTRYPFYRRLGGSQGRSGRGENLFPTAIRSRTVQPIAQSLYRLSYRAHTHTHTHARARTHTRTHPRARARARTHAHAHAHIHTPTRTRARARTRTHTHTHARARAHPHARTHTHTQRIN